MYIPSLFCSCYEKPPGAFMYPFHFHFHFHLHLHLTSIHQAISYVANAHLRPAPKHLPPPPRPAQRYPSVPPTISTTSQPSINVTNPIHTSTPPSHRSAPRPTSNGLCMYACMHACMYVLTQPQPNRHVIPRRKDQRRARLAPPHFNACMYMGAKVHGTYGHGVCWG